MMSEDSEDQVGDYRVGITTPTGDEITWYGYADNPADALGCASLCLETGAPGKVKIWPGITTS